MSRPETVLRRCLPDDGARVPAYTGPVKRWLFLTLLLGACTGETPPRDEETCCTCLAGNTTPRGGACLPQSTQLECVARLDSNEPLQTSPSCLRDVCGEQCAALGFSPPARSVMQTCCTCLTMHEQAPGMSCWADSVESCTNVLDDGQQLVTAPVCLETGCRVECALVQRTDAADGGVDGGV